MVNKRIQQALTALQDVGIPAIKGFPGSKVQVVRNPAVVVSLERYTEQSIVLAVDVYAPAEQGSSACEETAIMAAQTLQEEMATCTVEGCQFAGQMGLFRVRVLAQWPRELDYAVRINGEDVAHVTACHAEKKTARLPYVDSATGETLSEVDGIEWNITVTDIWPLKEKLPVENTDAFTLLILRPGGLDGFPECVWTKISLEETPAGVLRTRVATTIKDRIVAAG